MILGGIIAFILLILFLVSFLLIVSSPFIFLVGLYKGLKKDEWKILLISLFLSGGAILGIILTAFFWAMFNLAGMSPLQQTNVPILY